jgi:hypothetical protein
MPKDKVTQRITPKQVDDLRILFARKEAQKFDLKDRKKLADAIIKTFPEFKDLVQSQIVRAIKTYGDELTDCKEYGTNFRQATLGMIGDRKFLREAITYVIIFWKNLASTNEFVGFPDDLYDFICRVNEYSIQKASGQNCNGILNEYDEDRILSLVIFAEKGILRGYALNWDKLARIQENGTNAQKKSSPKSVLLDIELVSIMERRKMISPDSQIFKLFYGATCMKYYIADKSAEELYIQSHARKEAYPPLFARAAMLGLKAPLMKLLLGSFEEGFCQFYNQHLILQCNMALQRSLADTPKETLDNVDAAIADDNPSYRDTHVKELIFFILGAAVRAALGVLFVLLKKYKLEGKLSIVHESLALYLLVTKDDAITQELPHQQIELREKKSGALLRASGPLFSIFAEMEGKLLDPMLTNARAIAAFGNYFITYIGYRADSLGFYDKVDEILHEALDKLDFLSTEIKDEIVETLRLKLFTYYFKSATKDLLLFIIRSLNNDKAISKLSFRAYTLLELVK